MEQQTFFGLMSDVQGLIYTCTLAEFLARVYIVSLHLVSPQKKTHRLYLKVFEYNILIVAFTAPNTKPPTLALCGRALFHVPAFSMRIMCLDGAILVIYLYGASCYAPLI